MEDRVPNYVPEGARKAVLTVSEAKGLDFHSVCVLDAGRHIDRVLRQDWRQRADSDIEDLRKRLAIDQLRVAVSRPAERLIWLDLDPTDRIVRQSIAFLNGGPVESGVSSAVPAALLKTIEEDDLDLEERVQRCQADARQYLQIKPEIASLFGEGSVDFHGCRFEVMPSCRSGADLPVRRRRPLEHL